MNGKIHFQCFEVLDVQISVLLILHIFYSVVFWYLNGIQQRCKALPSTPTRAERLTSSCKLNKASHGTGKSV